MYVAFSAIFRNVGVIGRDEHLLPPGAGFPKYSNDARSVRLNWGINSSYKLQAATKIDTYRRLADMLLLAHD